MANPIPDPQAVCSSITSSAIYIVATLAPGSAAPEKVRAWCANVAALTRSVGKRVPAGDLSCVFDQRSMVGFVDGTENPVGRKAVDSTIIGDEDPSFVGGSYVLVQKYLHNMTAWNALPVEAQERIMLMTTSQGERDPGRSSPVFALPDLRSNTFRTEPRTTKMCRTVGSFICARARHVMQYWGVAFQRNIGSLQTSTPHKFSALAWPIYIAAISPVSVGVSNGPPVDFRKPHSH